MTPVTRSTTPLVYDTLPALKVRHFTPAAERRIYTLARFYFLKDTLALSLAAFEKDPHPTSRVEFAVTGRADRLLLFSLTPGDAELALCMGGKKHALIAPEPAYFSGVDEQGWYWGANTQLSAAHLAEVGLHVKKDEVFSAALFKQQAEQSGFGSSFPITNPDTRLDIAAFTRFVAVDY